MSKCTMNDQTSPVKARDPILMAAADAAEQAWRSAVAANERGALLDAVREGAEAGHIDHGSPITLMIDPVDGTGNAAAGVPFCAFTGALAYEDRITEGLTRWLDTGREWWAHVDQPTRLRTTDGSLDASIDPGSRTHRIVDLAAAIVLVTAAGGVVVDAHGQPLGFTTEITGHWSGVVAASPELACELIELLDL